MKIGWSAVLSAGLLPLLLGAATDQEREAAKSQLEQFHRNQTIIDFVVNEAVELGTKADLLLRVKECNALAGRLVEEMVQAVTAKDDHRATEMGRHLLSVVERGVTANLDVARETVLPGSGRDGEWKGLGERCGEILKPADTILGNLPSAGHADLKEVLRALHDARIKVIRTVQTAPSK